MIESADPAAENTNRRKILAIASGGGHWEQMMLLRDAFAGHDVYYATTLAGLPVRNGIVSASVVSDCNRDEPLKMLRCAWDMFRLILREKPDVVISTGALPGLIGIALGHFMRRKTIWVDSIANVEELSMGGRYARWFADLRLTQWEHLAIPGGAEYVGALL